MWQKLKFFFDRVSRLHSTKEHLTASVANTGYTAASIKHVDQITPNLSLIA